jgi:hypothetical protein
VYGARSEQKVVRWSTCVALSSWLLERTPELLQIDDFLAAYNTL